MISFFNVQGTTADAVRAAIIPVDEAIRQSEVKWGVGRLERLVSPTTLESYHRGWTRWRAATESGDIAAVREVGPKMIAAISYMGREAEAAGASPLSVVTWEALMPDGRILIIVKTTAEASEVGRVAGLGRDADLPPDLARVVQLQQAGRELVIYSIGEIARVLQSLELVNCIKTTWPGAIVTRGAITGENDASDWATSDPIRQIIETPLENFAPKKRSVA